MIYTDLVIYKLGVNGFDSPDTVAIGGAKSAILTRLGRKYTLLINNINWAAPAGQKKKTGFFSSKKKTNGVPPAMKMLETFHVLARSNGGTVFLKVEAIAFSPAKAEFDVVELNPDFGPQQPAVEQRIRRDSVVAGEFYRGSMVFDEADIEGLCAELSNPM